MLTIRKAQWEALVEDRFSQLRVWLLPHLREHFSEWLSRTPDEALDSLIAGNIAQARALGVTKSATVCHFVHLRVIFGDAFEALPWAAQTIEDPRLDGDHKIELLLVRAREVLRAAKGLVA